MEDALLAKITDPGNGFRKVAKLSDAKWGELQSAAPRIMSQRVSDQIKSDVVRCLLDGSVAEDLLSNWGIA